MRTLNRIVTGLFVLAMLAPLAARADDVITQEIAAAAIDRTDQRISLAKDLLTESPNANAQVELDAAGVAQNNARMYFMASQFGNAFTATRRARDHADKAISIARNLPNPEHVQQQVEHTRDMIDRAHDRLGSCDNSQARAMLSVALAMQKKAESAVDEGHYLGALQLTMAARERILQAMRLCNIQDSQNDQVLRELQRSDDIIARTADKADASTPETSRDQLTRAKGLQAQAWAEFRLAHLQPAVRLTREARRLAVLAGVVAGKYVRDGRIPVNR